MLPTEQQFSNSLSALSLPLDKVEAVNDFVTAVANFTNLVQAGPTGNPGILKFGNAAMAALLLQMPPVTDESWIPQFANAWQAGLFTSTITPGTVTNVLWIGSGGLDILTVPSPIVTIPTLAVAKDLLMALLATVTITPDAPLPFATAIRTATLALEFTCIGLGPPPTFTPIPIILPAE